MPTYSASSLNGSGSLGTSAMTAGQTYTFELSNTPTTIGSVAYFTLEANSTANKNLTTQTSCAGTFGGFLNEVDEDSLIENDFGFSISVFGSGGAFTLMEKPKSFSINESSSTSFKNPPNVPAHEV
jgi:hypothetical protein